MPDQFFQINVRFFTQDEHGDFMGSLDLVEVSHLRDNVLEDEHDIVSSSEVLFLIVVDGKFNLFPFLSFLQKSVGVGWVFHDHSFSKIVIGFQLLEVVLVGLIVENFALIDVDFARLDDTAVEHALGTND